MNRHTAPHSFAGPCSPLDGENNVRQDKRHPHRGARSQALHLKAGAVTQTTRSLVACALFVAFLFLALAAGAARAEVPASPFVEVGQTVRPAVVSIRTIRLTGASGMNQGPLQEMYRRYFPDAEGEGGRFESPSTGSGFVVDGAGHVLTNHHVIDAADEIFVRFGGERREYRATLQGTDPNTDLALLFIDPAGRALPVLEFADSEAVAVGSWAVAVGNPFGNLESSLTVGVVSAKGRGDLVIGGLTPRFQDFIQTDASINFGNSGGPLVDVQGRVIGVNTAINSRGQGIGFAVPSNLVRRIYGDLRDHGRVIRGYLGVTTEDLVLVVGEEQSGPEGGARILEVTPGSPAAAAGLRAGDVVIAWDGAPVDTRRELLFLVAGTAPGTELDLDIERDGARLALRVRTEEWLEDPTGTAHEGADAWLGMEVAAVAGTDPRVERLRDMLGVAPTAGVMVVAVAEESSGAEAGIRPGDVVVSMDGHEIEDLAAWEQARTLLSDRRDPLTVLVRTGTSERYVQLVPRPVGIEN